MYLCVHETKKQKNNLIAFEAELKVLAITILNHAGQALQILHRRIIECKNLHIKQNNLHQYIGCYFTDSFHRHLLNQIKEIRKGLVSDLIVNDVLVSNINVSSKYLAQFELNVNHKARVTRNYINVQKHEKDRMRDINLRKNNNLFVNRLYNNGLFVNRLCHYM